jgi:hypothetical protein
VSVEQAVENARPILEKRLGNPLQTPATDLVYVVPERLALESYLDPLAFSWPAPCFPKENCLAWVVRVSEELPIPPGALNHQPHAEIWVDARTGEIVGVEDWCH